MAFEAHVEMANGVAKISLSGELDAQAAPVFKAEIEKAAEEQPKAVALMMEDLEYMASAGIRVFIFAKQKMGADVKIFAIKPQPQIIETLEMTGLTYSVEVLDAYDPMVIEQ